MKGQLWYKSHRDDFSRSLQEDVEVFTEPPGSQSKSGYHLVVTETTKQDGYVEVLKDMRAEASWNYQATIYLDYLIEHLESRSKSDSRPVLKTDLPTPSVQEAPARGPVVPKTPLELCNLLSGLDSVHLGTIVGQLLVEKRVSLIRCQNLLRHSGLLARESGRLRRELLNIQENKPPQEDEEEDE